MEEVFNIFVLLEFVDVFIPYVCFYVYPYFRNRLSPLLVGLELCKSMYIAGIKRNTIRPRLTLFQYYAVVLGFP